MDGGEPDTVKYRAEYESKRLHLDFSLQSRDGTSQNRSGILMTNEGKAESKMQFTNPGFDGCQLTESCNHMHVHRSHTITKLCKVRNHDSFGVLFLSI